MQNKNRKGDNADVPVTELRWMAEFLASHGQQRKALEIYRALVDTLTNKKIRNDKKIVKDEGDQAA